MKLKRIQKKDDDLVLIHFGKLDLGNNYSYSHLIEAIKEDDKYKLYCEIQSSDNVTLIYNTNYGKGITRTCGSDLQDFIR